LLAPDTIEAMPGENRRRRAATDLFAAADKLAAARFPPMSLEEIQAEVTAVRAQGKQRASGA